MVATDFAEEQHVVHMTPKQRAMMAQLVETERLAKQYAEQVKTLHDTLVQAFEKDGNTKSVEGGGLRITYIEPTEACTFDVKAFRRDYPDLHAEYIKTSARAASVKVTIKEQAS